jgi:predicted kinase
MSNPTPVLHILYGKAGAGKSTLCSQLALAPQTILIAQDHWMAELYPEELQTVADYIRLVRRLRGAIGPHVSALLRLGVSVVLDWPANTAETRAWLRSLSEAAGAAHILHVLDVTDEVCLERLRVRNASGLHPYSVSDAEFEELSRYCELPAPVEGFNIVIHRPGLDM